MTLGEDGGPSPRNVYMTAIVCFLDRSDGRSRITALSDSRASRVLNGQWHTITDDLTKIFRVRLACHALQSFDTSTGAFRDAYYATDLGLCFAGYCLEAMTVVSQFIKCVERLVDASDNGAQPIPNPDRLLVLLRDLCSEFFRTHAFPKEQDLELILYGYTDDGVAWAGKVSHYAATGAKYELVKLDEGSVVVAGDCPSLEKVCMRFARRISKRLGRLPITLAGEARAREEAMLYRAKRKYLENKIKKEIASHYAPTVGGRLHKSELFFMGRTASLTFTGDASESALLDRIFGEYEHLRYMPVNQATGLDDVLHQFPDLSV